MTENKNPVHGAKSLGRVPVIMQMEALECGAAALAMVMAYYGKWVPLEQVRYDCGVSRNGSNAKNMLVAARSYGFDAQGFRCDTEGLKNGIVLPCILHWNFNHFVVLTGSAVNMPGSMIRPGAGSGSSSKSWTAPLRASVFRSRPGKVFSLPEKRKASLNLRRSVCGAPARQPLLFCFLR